MTLDTQISKLVPMYTLENSERVANCCGRVSKCRGIKKFDDETSDCVCVCECEVINQVAFLLVFE